MENDDKPIISWEIKSHEEREKSQWFYFITLGVMVLLLVFSVWQKNFLFGIFIILATGTILFLSTQRPEVFLFKLSDKEISIGEETVYSYDRFNHFDIYEFGDGDFELFLVFKEKLKAILRIRIYKGDKEKIEEFLKVKLPQKKTEPSLLDLVSKIIGI
ncbi:MAG: hypothetical protein WC705_03360 [Candidatus Paceibacterota bacterium]|jgi:hypothetical protein